MNSFDNFSGKVLDWIFEWDNPLSWIPRLLLFVMVVGAIIVGGIMLLVTAIAAC